MVGDADDETGYSCDLEVMRVLMRMVTFMVMKMDDGC